jgi:splicing factor U2AF subunit
MLLSSGMRAPGSGGAAGAGGGEDAMPDSPPPGLLSSAGPTPNLHPLSVSSAAAAAAAPTPPTIAGLAAAMAATGVVGAAGGDPSAAMLTASTPAAAPQQRIADLEAQVARLSASLEHYRAACAAVQARYQLFSPDVARPARRVYIGGLPMGTTSDDLAAHVNFVLALAGGTICPGAPVTSCTVFSDRAYAFVELRSVEEASNCMALDGVPFRDSARLRVRRPNNYDAAAAMLLGPTSPDPGMDGSRLGAVRTAVPDTPHKLFMGGLPCDWDAVRVRALLAPYGTLTAFNLVMDKATGNSKGYAFAEFEAPGATDYAIAALAGAVVGGKPLTIKRAVIGPGGVMSVEGGGGGMSPLMRSPLGPRPMLS